MLTALTTWQGVINQKSLPSRVYVISRPSDRFWLKAAVPASIRRVWLSAWSPGMSQARWLRRLIGQVQPRLLKGLIVDNPKIPATINVATTLAGLDDAIVVTPHLAEQLRYVTERYHLHPLPIRMNLAAMPWANAMQANLWAVSHLLPKMNADTWVELDTSVAGGIRDYAVAHRLFVSNLPGTVITSPGLALWTTVLDHFTKNTPIMGFPPSEGTDMPLLSATGHWVNASAEVDNLSVWAIRVPLEDLPVPKWPNQSPISLKPNHVYLSFQWSDGDNLRFLTRRLPTLWANPNAKVPQAWTISPALVRTAPWIWAWLIRHMPGSEWMVGPSGIGYTQSYPLSLLPDFLHLTQEAARAEHLATMNVWGDDRFGALAPVDAKSMAGLPFSTIFLGEGDVNAPWIYDRHTLFIDDINGYTPNSWDLLTVIQSVIRRDQMQHVLIALPVFVNGWQLKPEDLNWVLAQLRRHYPVTVITPSVLGASIAERLRKEPAWSTVILLGHNRIRG